MNKQVAIRGYQILNTVLFVGVIVVNALANILPISNLLVTAMD